MSDKHAICPVEDLPPGDRIIQEIERTEVAVFNVGGEYVAVVNYCVHQSGPVCEGPVTGTTAADPDEWEYDWVKDGEILTCPWHGWEFDLLSGENLSDPDYRLLTYDVAVEDGTIKVEMS
jgi:nitrite reductase/ring-hydroxylating ferredoxin subunit